MYDDDDDDDPRRTSAGSQHQSRNAIYHEHNAVNPTRTEEDYTSRRLSIPRKPMPERNMSNGNVIIGPNAQRRPQPAREYSWEKQQTNNHSPSPPLGSTRERSGSDTATSHFPLNDIDYESSPAAVAQELSNLQALRRMSMNVDLGAAGDPDLPHLNPATMPSSPSNSEDDPSRLFWVPARLHPELAPKEFKTFLESKAEQIKRRSGDLNLSQFSSPTSSRSNSLEAPSSDSSGLKRKKSMLSRQIHNPAGYQDGAERLERKRNSIHGATDPNLEELESLVQDAENRLSLDSSNNEETGDILLPSVPGSSLKRSTRTKYRRGGSVKGRGDRSTYSQRMARKAGGEDAPISPSAPDVPALPSEFSEVSNLASTLSYTSAQPPVPTATKRETHNFSRPAMSRVVSQPQRLPQDQPAATTFDSIFNDPNRFSTASAPEKRAEPMAYPQERPETSFERRPVPQIVEVPPPEEDNTLQCASTTPSPTPPAHPPVRHPERSSSREQKPPAQRPGMPPKQHSSFGVPPAPRTGAISPPGSMRMHQQPQSLEQPSPLPGNNTNTAELSFIPTLTVDKRADHKKKEEPKKSSWSWLLGKEEDKEKPDKPKAKIVKPPQSDNTRLDVLQTSIDGSKGRESVVLDRESMKLEEERKKESARKSSEHKKEKDGFLSSIFGGKKAKDKEAAKKMSRLSPEPSYRELKPDIDYNWTRFSILEERAIYRMAHIKLANPRRALYSQVLLSNFMYSYLAKVQQMHPQMNLPTSAKQQRNQQQAQPQPQPKSSKQPDEFTQYQRYQQVSPTH